MATVVNFQGKNYIEPGSYAATTYNPTSVVNVSNFGNVMIIDTGLSINGDYEFAGGSGINGELNKGLKSVYEFENYEDFLSFMGGGLVPDIAEKIFSPISGSVGAPKLYYVRAATTKAAKAEIVLSDGSFELTCKNEGKAGNGIVKNNVLRAGYGIKIVQGEESETFKLQIYKGSFAGVDEYGEPFGAYNEEKSIPNLIAESPDYTTLGELYDWASSDRIVLSHFQVSMTGERSSVLFSESLTAATGGTTTYLSGTEYSDVLEAISELDVTFFLTTNLDASEGAGVDATTNGKLFTFLKDGSAKFTQFMVVAGGSGNTDLFGESDSSESIAKFYNSGQVVVTHGSPIVTRKDKNGTKTLKPIYLAAAIVGLNAGLAPQTPITFKRVGYQSFAYDLKKREREKALQAGILHVRNVSGYWSVNQGITTLLDNKQTIAADGQSFELSVELIKAQLNKELIIEGQVRFTGQTAAQASPESVKNFVETKLSSLIASAGNDNLLISWKNVKVAAKNGDYFISYDFVPNVPVNKTFFLGNVLDFSVES